MKKKELLIGCHVSISGGFCNAIKEGMEIGCTAIQIFTKSNRRWASKAITDEESTLFTQTQKKSTIKIIIAHASYLINLGSSTPGVQEKSLKALINEIERCHQLQIPLLVLHPGTVELNNKELEIQKIGDYINKAIEETRHCSTKILIETMAGQGKSIGNSFQELALILNQIKNKARIGICFDTCHTFAAGYDITTPESYQNTFRLFNDTIGLQYLQAFHMNDSKKPFKSRLDRHENIGDGLINIQAFAMILNDSRFINIPKILETPKMENLENDKRNLQKLLYLIQ